MGNRPHQRRANYGRRGIAFVLVVIGLALLAIVGVGGGLTGAQIPIFHIPW